MLHSSESLVQPPSRMHQFMKFKLTLAEEFNTIRNDLYFDTSFLLEADAIFAEKEIQRELDSYFSTREALVRLYRERLLLASVRNRNNAVGKSEIASWRGFDSSSSSSKWKAAQHPSHQSQ